MDDGERMKEAENTQAKKELVYMFYVQPAIPSERKGSDRAAMEFAAVRPALETLVPCALHRSVGHFIKPL